jgi:hypothetical protein
MVFSNFICSKLQHALVHLLRKRGGRRSSSGRPLPHSGGRHGRNRLAHLTTLKCKRLLSAERQTKGANGNVKSNAFAQGSLIHERADTSANDETIESKLQLRHDT